VQNLAVSEWFTCEVLPGLPGTGPAPHQFRREGQRTHSEGLVVRVKPVDGEPWIGNFQYGDGDVYVSGVFVYSSDQFICVVARGQGYLVCGRRPSEYEIVRSYPIRDVRTIPEKSLIVFADYTELSAYGSKGFAWMTKTLSWDGLKITEVTAERITGVAWDAPANKEVGFSVDVTTGRSQGGSSPKT